MKRIPDTTIINEALQIVKAALSDNIFNHSMRTYYFGCEFAEIRIKGIQEKNKKDPEIGIPENLLH